MRLILPLSCEAHGVHRIEDHAFGPDLDAQIAIIHSAEPTGSFPVG